MFVCSAGGKNFRLGVVFWVVFVVLCFFWGVGGFQAVDFLVPLFSDFVGGFLTPNGFLGAPNVKRFSKPGRPAESWNVVCRRRDSSFAERR